MSKSLLLKYGSAFVIQTLVLLIIAVGLQIVGISDLPGWAFAMIGVFVFGVALAAQSDDSSRR